MSAMVDFIVCLALAAVAAMFWFHVLHSWSLAALNCASVVLGWYTPPLYRWLKSRRNQA